MPQLRNERKITSAMAVLIMGVCRERPLWRSVNPDRESIATRGTPQRAFPTEDSSNEVRKLFFVRSLFYGLEPAPSITGLNLVQTVRLIRKRRARMTEQRVETTNQSV